MDLDERKEKVQFAIMGGKIVSRSQENSGGEIAISGVSTKNGLTANSYSCTAYYIGTGRCARCFKMQNCRPREANHWFVNNLGMCHTIFISSPRPCDNMGIARPAVAVFWVSVLKIQAQMLKSLRDICEELGIGYSAIRRSSTYQDAH